MNAEIVVTNHAVERFIDRSRKIGQAVPADPEKAIRRLFMFGHHEVLSPGHTVKRIINNKFQKASYFVNSGWRLVLVGNSIVTVERVERDQN